MKKILIFLLCLSIMLIPAAAAGPNIIDSAQLLSDSEESLLNSQLSAITGTYQTDIVILCVSSLDGKSAQAYADDYFDHNGYGVGTERSGILLLLSMGERSWAVSTSGYAIRVVTNSDIDRIMRGVLPYLSSASYYAAFQAFLDQVQQEYQAHQDDPFDESPDFSDPYYDDSGKPSFGTALFSSLIIGAVIAGVALLVMRSSMNTAKAQSGAQSYLVNNSYQLYQQSDLFLYSRTTRVRRQENSGGSHRGSSGRSHGGRSGRF